MTAKKTLSKKESLKGKKTISEIFESGELVKSFPILFKFTAASSEEPGVKVMFSISKKKQKKAVKRNRIKRRLRESYRLNKLSLYESCINEGILVDLVVVQVTGEEVEWEVLTKKMTKGLSKIQVELEKKRI